MATLLTQNPASLDHKNRFFEDNKAKMQEMMVFDYAGERTPQYSDKKELAGKVTKRQFIQMPNPEIRPPPGYRAAVPARPATGVVAKKQTRKTKQVSEVDDQDASNKMKAKKASSANMNGSPAQAA